MKKFLTIILCILLVCTVSLSVYAAAETEVSEEAVTSAEAVGGEDASALLSVRFKAWVLPHLEEISVVVTLIFTVICQMRKHTLLNRSVGLMNDNAVSIAEHSAELMSRALTDMENASAAVKGYDERIAALLEAFGSVAGDKARLEGEMSELREYLKTAAAANLEFSNELAELLNLANIPNFKKEEIGARHLAAARSIAEAQRSMEQLIGAEEEVSDHDGKTA